MTTLETIRFSELRTCTDYLVAVQPEGADATLYHATGMDEVYDCLRDVFDYDSDEYIEFFDFIEHCELINGDGYPLVTVYNLGIIAYR